MKEKIKKNLLWIILIFFTLVFAGSLFQLIMIFLFSGGDLKEGILSLFSLAISYLVITKLKKKLNVPDLFKKTQK